MNELEYVQESELDIIRQEQEAIKVAKVMGKVVLGITNDPIQQLYVDSIVTDINLERHVHRITKEKDLKELKFLTRKAILDTNSVVYIKVECRVTEPIIVFLSSLYLKNKLVFLFLYNQRTVSYVSDRLVKNIPTLKPTRLPVTEDYGSKKELLEKTLENWSINFSDKDTRNLMVKIMISQEDNLESIRNTLEVTRLSRIVITKEFLNDTFDNIEFLKLNDLFEYILRSNSPKKLTNYLEYFLHAKEYNPNWLLMMFKDYLLNVNTMYTLKARGIVKHTLDKTTLNTRLAYTNIPNKEHFSKLNQYEQQNLLDLVNDIPFNYMSHLLKVVFKREYLNVDELGLKQLFMEINLLKNDFGFEKGFKNERTFKEFLKNRKAKSKA